MNTLQPRTVDELSAILRDASAARRALIPVGNRATLRAVPQSAAAASFLSTTSLDASIDHVAGDLVATIPAGVTLAAANAALAREGQWLPLDPPFPDRATIGGSVAGNESGPRRHRFGAPRDLIIGVHIVLADGRVAKAGGRVVKNVAGYDLSRLMCGSLGSLAVITSATFKLSPLPATSRTLVAEVGRSPRIGDLIQALVNAPLTPSTIEVVAPPMRLLIRLETTATAGEYMAQAASAICAHHGAPARIMSGDEEATLWARAEAGVWAEPGSVVKISVLPTDVPYLLSEIESGCDAQGVQWSVTGRAALGVMFVRVHGNAPAIRPLLADWRHRAGVGGGSLALHSSAPDVEQFDRWGDPGDAMPIMRAVKARFDPHSILSPGMGPGRL